MIIKVSLIILEVAGHILSEVSKDSEGQCRLFSQAITVLFG